ncbi:hypothetical protein LTR84_012724 [Exophiala bonariae]|uniref:Uncharacterized protein n=1 Tax=Exophiala bonariae TaxID=1690606 RepID=A0AAV9NII0_9EURO|nr:hypothetical protein LTR84_012724 [Exophiala bonariae]
MAVLLLTALVISNIFLLGVPYSSSFHFEVRHSSFGIDPPEIWQSYYAAKMFNLILTTVWLIFAYTNRIVALSNAGGERRSDSWIYRKLLEKFAPGLQSPSNRDRAIAHIERLQSARSLPQRVGNIFALLRYANAELRSSFLWELVAILLVLLPVLSLGETYYDVITPKIMEGPLDTLNFEASTLGTPSGDNTSGIGIINAVHLYEIESDGINTDQLTAPPLPDPPTTSHSKPGAQVKAAQITAQSGILRPEQAMKTGPDQLVALSRSATGATSTMERGDLIVTLPTQRRSFSIESGALLATLAASDRNFYKLPIFQAILWIVVLYYTIVILFFALVGGGLFIVVSEVNSAWYFAILGFLIPQYISSLSWVSMVIKRRQRRKL